MAALPKSNLKMKDVAGKVTFLIKGTWSPSGRKIPKELVPFHEKVIEISSESTWLEALAHFKIPLDPERYYIRRFRNPLPLRVFCRPEHDLREKVQLLCQDFAMVQKVNTVLLVDREGSPFPKSFKLDGSQCARAKVSPPMRKACTREATANPLPEKRKRGRQPKKVQFIEQDIEGQGQPAQVVIAVEQQTSNGDMSRKPKRLLRFARGPKNATRPMKKSVILTSSPLSLPIVPVPEKRKRGRKPKKVQLVEKDIDVQDQQAPAVIAIETQTKISNVNMLPKAKRLLRFARGPKNAMRPMKKSVISAPSPLSLPKPIVPDNEKEQSPHKQEELVDVEQDNSGDENDDGGSIVDRNEVDYEDIRERVYKAAQRITNMELLLVRDELVKLQEKSKEPNARTDLWMKWSATCPYPAMILRGLFDV